MSVRIVAVAAATALCAALTPVAADERESVVGANGAWGLDPAISSAQLARDGWQFMAMSTLSWPDGRQAIVTLWQSRLGDYARCFDYFDAALIPAGGKCERSGTGL